MARRHPVTERIDKVLDDLRLHNLPVTMQTIMVNAKKRLTWSDFSSDEALEAVVRLHARRRLKALGYVIVDELENVREDFVDVTPDQYRAQIAVKREHVRYAIARLEADEAVHAFLTVKQETSDAPIYAGDFLEEIDSIYAEHGLTR